MVRKLRRRYGEIHITFGEPLSLASALRSNASPEETEAGEQSLAVQKLAFEVAVRINRATPVTPTSLIALTLLGMGDRALTVEEILRASRNVFDYVRRRQLPATSEIDIDNVEEVRQTLDLLVENGVISCFAEGVEPVYAIGADQHLTAAYYRNTIIHFFVNGAIAELALLHAAEPNGFDPLSAFWNAAMELRDLLKFEFFFAEKEKFRGELRNEVALHDPHWEAQVARGPAEIQALLRRFKPFSAHRVLRPFLEAYRVVADALTLVPADAPFDQNAFLSRCLALGKQYRLQRRIRSSESVSKVLFETALRLARNRELVDPASPDLAEKRRAFAEEIRDAIRRVDAIGALAASRLAGMIE
jgi:glycerol-3-phosphate O-acyltransferase